MDLKTISEAMIKYLKDSENESDFYDWLDNEGISGDDMYDSIVKELG